MLNESRGDIFITPNIGPFLLFLVAEYSEGFYDLPCHPDLIFPSAAVSLLHSAYYNAYQAHQPDRICRSARQV